MHTSPKTARRVRKNVTLPADLIAAAKSKARQQGQTLRQYLNALVRWDVTGEHAAT